MKWFYDMVVFLTALPGLIWFRPKIYYPEGKQKLKGGTLLISNHIGVYDPIYLMYTVKYRRHHFLCMKEFYDNKFVAWFFDKCMCIPVDRENFGMETFRKITGILKDGGLVSMFPEGHVNFDEGKAKQFKQGMVLMAIQGNAKIVPVCISKRKHFWNRLRSAVGQPIDLKALYGGFPSISQIDEIAEMLYKKEEELRLFLEAQK